MVEESTYHKTISQTNPKVADDGTAEDYCCG
jgi:hypothetical protein